MMKAFIQKGWWIYILFFLLCPFFHFVSASPAPAPGNTPSALYSEQVTRFYAEVLAEKTAQEQKIEPKQEIPPIDASSFLASASDYLDELYKPLVPKGKFFLNEEFYFFKQYNYGDHGSASYEKVLAHPYFASMKNYMAFSPVDNLELAVGYRETFPVKYYRSTYGPTSQNVILMDTIYSDYLQDYSFNSRLRLDSMEFYLSAMETRQRNKLDEVNQNTDTFYYNKIKSNYEDFKIGARFISSPAAGVKESNLSKLKKPLLAKGQLNAEAEVSSQKGSIARKFEFDDDPTQKDGHILRKLTPAYVPSFYLKYGLDENFQADLGLQYKTPYKFKHEYKLGLLNGTNTFRRATYKINDTFYLPARLHWRPYENMELGFASDFTYGRQRLDYNVINTNGTTTNYPAKKLSYINTVPTLNLAYLYDADQEIEKDTFSGLSKTMLSKGQALLELEFKKDITHLYKSADNTTQNIFDPSSIFLYPLDTFMAGTEYAAHYSENSIFYSMSVPQQNYFYLKSSLAYALNDRLNLEMAAGYRSESYVHTFVVSPFQESYFKLYPYYFIDAACDWKITKNSLLSFKSHFVPSYRIRSHIYDDAYPKDFKTEARYIEASLSWRALF